MSSLDQGLHNSLHGNIRGLVVLDIGDLVGNLLLLIVQTKRAVTREEAVHILELEALGLGEEDVDNGNKSGVEHGKDNVRAPANVGNGNGRDLDNELCC